MMRSIWPIAFSLLLLGAHSADAQDYRSQHNNSGLSDFLNSDAGTDTTWTLGGIAIVVAAATAFYVPTLFLNDNYNETLYFAPYPYVSNYRGYQLLALDRAEGFYEIDTSDVTRKSWAGRLTIENGSNFDGVNRLAGQLKLESDSRWGILSSWHYFHENLAAGQTDESLFGATNLTFRFAQNEITSMYTGLGLNVLTERKQANYGVNFTYGGDWFPVEPLIVSASFDLGTLGNTSLFHTRASVGAIYHGCEFFVGYDFLRLGSTNVQGPMAGVRYWF